MADQQDPMSMYSSTMAGPVNQGPRRRVNRLSSDNFVLARQQHYDNHTKALRARLQNLAATIKDVEQHDEGLAEHMLLDTISILTEALEGPFAKPDKKASSSKKSAKSKSTKKKAEDDGDSASDE